MLLKLTQEGKKIAGEPYLPQDDYMLAKDLCEKEGIRGGKLIAKLRKLSGKQGIKGGKAYWVYILRRANCLIEEGEENVEK